MKFENDEVPLRTSIIVAIYFANKENACLKFMIMVITQYLVIASYMQLDSIVFSYDSLSHFHDIIKLMI